MMLLPMQSAYFECLPQRWTKRKAFFIACMKSGHTSSRGRRSAIVRPRPALATITEVATNSFSL